jgi:hypothetical protein
MTRKNLLALTAALALLPLGANRACAQNPVQSGISSLATEGGMAPAVKPAQYQRPNVQIYYIVWFIPSPDIRVPKVWKVTDNIRDASDTVLWLQNLGYPARYETRYY